MSNRPLNEHDWDQQRPGSGTVARDRAGRRWQTLRMGREPREFELTTDELRAVARFAAACARPTLALFPRACPDDDRPAAALEAAQAFADGAPRSNLQRTTAAAAHRAGREAPAEAARHAAYAAGDAAASAYLHPLAKATQVRHILGAAAHAARAGELARGDDPVVAEYMLDAAARRATPTVLDVLALSELVSCSFGRCVYFCAILSC